MSANLVSLYGSLYGSLYFASVLSTAFYGVTCMQTFFYYVHYQDDPLRIKLFVAIMWSFNTIHEALSVAGAYKYIMVGLVNPGLFSALTVIPELILQGLLTTLAALPTQGFLVYRIYVFSGGSIIVPVIWVVLALTKFVCYIIYAGTALYSANGVHAVGFNTLVSGSLETFITIILSVVAAADIIIAISMTFLLVRKRNAATFGRTTHMLHRLVMFAVNTGIWTAVFAFMAILFLHVFPENALYAVFAIPLCSVYCNTLLANLNARMYIQGGMTTQDANKKFGQNPGVWVSSGSHNSEQRADTKLLFPMHETTKVEALPDGNRSIATTESAV